MGRHEGIQTSIVNIWENISQYQPEMSGVNIVEVTRTENPNYLFVTIDTEGLTAGMYDFNLNKGKKKVATYSYELKQRSF